MKILEINKFYHQGQDSGGVGSYLFALEQLLKDHGQEVVAFAMNDPQGGPARADFLDYLDLKNFGFDLASLKKAGHLIYSPVARAKLERLLAREKPEIAHLHNIYHQLSPSILLALKKRQIPVVMTVHDFKLICPNYRLFVDNQICERCKRHRYYQCVWHRCLKGSRLASLAAAGEMSVHKMFGWYKKYVDIFIAPSLFLKNKLLEWGMPSDKIVVIPHFIEERGVAAEAGRYILYFGRLSPEKGIMDLLSIAKNIKSEILIAGGGEQAKELTEYIKNNKIKNVRMAGHLNKQELQTVLAQSLFTVNPVRYYEIFGMSMLESLACGKPVVAPANGAIPEMIKHDYNGCLYRLGDRVDLKNKIMGLLDNREKIAKLAIGAKTTAEKYNKEKHYKALSELFSGLVKR